MVPLKENVIGIGVPQAEDNLPSLYVCVCMRKWSAGLSVRLPNPKQKFDANIEKLAGSEQLNKCSQDAKTHTHRHTYSYISPQTAHV